MTQTRLAALSGVSAQAISMLERGTRTFPRHDTVMLLVKALDLSEAESEALRSAASRPRTIAPDSRSEVTDGYAGPAAPPRWLPPAVGDFTGRDNELGTLHGILSSDDAPSTVVVAAIEGMGGVGKTTLAVRAAHLVAANYPDGQLYINLRGFGPGERVSAAQALNQILLSLGEPAAERSLDEASGQYRSALAGRRVLVVLDNVADADQVMPLLPGTAGCAAIVTSRHSLAGIPGARHIRLDVLSTQESLSLLGAIIGEQRVQEDLRASTQVVRRCGQLPLAIRIAAARLVARPGWPVSVMAAQLSDERRRLDELELRDAGVRASFAASLKGLAASDDPIDALAATHFPLLGVLDAPDVSTAVAARLLDRSLEETERIMERLVDFHLLETPAQGRYRMHDLLRSYVREYANDNLNDAEWDAAIVRVLRLYNTIAWRNYAHASPAHVRLRYADERWLDDSPSLGTSDDELRWLMDERANLLDTVQQASSRSGVPTVLVTQVAIACIHPFNTGGYWRELIAISRASLDVATASGDRLAQAFAHHDIAAGLSQLGDTGTAVSEMQAAVELFSLEHDEPGEAMSLCNLAYAFKRGGRIEQGIRAAERALSLSASRGFRHIEATTCLALGLLHGEAGQRQHELDYHERSRAIYAEMNYDRGRARALFNIALAHESAGRTKEAIAGFEETSRLCDRLGLKGTASEARASLARLLIVTGRSSQAMVTSREALEMAIEVGSEMAEAQARHVLGSALNAMQRPDEARHEWQLAQLIYERLGAPMATDVSHLLTVTAGRSATT